MRTIIASDHVGYPLKKSVLRYLTSIRAEVIDVGTGTADTPVDYPDYARKVVDAISSGEAQRDHLLLQLREAAGGSHEPTVIE